MAALGGKEEPVEGPFPALRPAGAHRFHRREQIGGIGIAGAAGLLDQSGAFVRIGRNAVAGEQPGAERELRLRSPPGSAGGARQAPLRPSQPPAATARIPC